MPTKNHAKVRLLLKHGKAKVVKRTPFTIQLLTTSKTYKQDITLGVDAGSKHVGLSATTSKQEVFVAELRPRNDVVELLSSRRELRHSRRNRKTRYRKTRFLNRVKSKHKGWLAPSVEVKIWNHIQGINLVNKILPLTTIRVETAEFDLQRLKAMEEGDSLPVGKDYQLCAGERVIIARKVCRAFDNTAHHSDGIHIYPRLRRRHIDRRANEVSFGKRLRDREDKVPLSPGHSLVYESRVSPDEINADRICGSVKRLGKPHEAISVKTASDERHGCDRDSFVDDRDTVVL